MRAPIAAFIVRMFAPCYNEGLTGAITGGGS